MPDAHLSAADWSWEPTVILGLVAVTAAYVAALRRRWIGSQDDVSPWFARPGWRPPLFAAGIGVAAVALLSPIDTGGDRYLLSLHMLQHLLLMMVAPPLFILGGAGMRTPPVALPARLRAALAWVTRPWPALAVFNAVLLVWHIPALYDATLTDEAIHIVEHVTFFAVGVIFWWPIVDPLRGERDRPVSSMEKIALLVIGGVPPTALGFVFAMGSSAFYDFYARAPRLWGVSAVLDQQIAGVIMFGLGNVIYFVAVSVVFLRMFGNPADDEVEAGAGGERAGQPAR